ncbi:FMN-dependent NADH-azoreductase [Rhizohabitans arisaemae]|uniref:FMN-dependent NADH-azoreductase n=1 Tax=Rhizohabitans arisaemae TaxID=2720610 RepID=UPI0024B1D7A2|nr:NAD(P)H-dependent oxidoreductase [Rhizohabitans arisaemae]
MVNLLHLDASARRGSFSRRLGAVFVAEWRAANPDGFYAYRDLVADPVPPLDEARVEIAIRSGVNGVRGLAEMDEVLAAVPALSESWAVTRPLVTQLLEADVLLLGTPMYNFSVPASLKAWIDRVTLPWLPLHGKSAVVVSARGGAYGPGAPREHHDFQEPYLRAYFAALGLEDVAFVHAELTHATVMPFLAGLRRTHEASHSAALDAVRTLASRLPAGAPSRD